MVFKINISTKDGKTFKVELDSESLVGKELGQTIQGSDINADLTGYELLITGTSDKSGFMGSEDVEGIGLKKLLFGVGKGMWTKPKGDKKKNKRTKKGLRLRKTVRGKVISDAITQINTKVTKDGAKPLAEIFASEIKAPEASA